MNCLNFKQELIKILQTQKGHLKHVFLPYFGIIIIMLQLIRLY